jgi:hypothetical protein
MGDNTTSVSHDMVDLNSVGSDNLYDDAAAFKAFLGAVHGDFNSHVNKNIVSESNTLRRINGTNILEKGIKEIMKINPIRDINSLPPPAIPQFNNTAAIPAPEPAPVRTPSVEFTLAIDRTPDDSNQLQLNFDKSATALQIFESLEQLHIKINALTRKMDDHIASKIKTKKSKL